MMGREFRKEARAGAEGAKASGGQSIGFSFERRRLARAMLTNE